MLEFLENDLADTYVLLKDRSKFPVLAAIYNYMIDHSREHADHIKRLHSKSTPPTVDEEKIFYAVDGTSPDDVYAVAANRLSPRAAKSVSPLCRSLQ